MDLFCPHCTRRVTVPDDKAGLVLNCPLCGKQFQAPALAPSVHVQPPAPSPRPDAGLTPTQAAPTPAMDAGPPPPPPPPGEYTRSLTLHLRGLWLPVVPPLCLLLIFVLSFFPWHFPSVSPWSMAFTHLQARFMIYMILLIPCILAAIAAMLVELKIIPVPAKLAVVVAWKDLVVAALLFIGFLALFSDYLIAHFGSTDVANPILLTMKIAVRLHFLALLASLLAFWLHRRKPANLPPPIVELRW